MKRFVKRAIRSIARRALAQTGAPPGTWDGYTRDALQLAAIIDCTPEMLARPPQHPERIDPDRSRRVVAWYLPAFDNPFYGGIMTILRLADFMARRHGMTQRFLICGAADAAVISGHLARAFPGLASAQVLVLDSVDAINSILPADYSVATLWTTAYVVLGVQNTGLKMYMVQDFEPAFYPAGSTYAQAELSYRFGFYAIANTESIKAIYEQQYGGTAVVLRPAIDKRVFHSETSTRAAGTRRLFYYARPGTPRNGFELAAAALKRLKARLGDQIDIVCAGATWDPANYGLDQVVRNVGLLRYEKTGDLYRSCHAGFVMMMTKHPSYLPFELMACGAVVVTNRNDANRWLLDDGVNCVISEPSASCLAEALERALMKFDELGPIREAASRLISETSGDWDASLERVSDRWLAGFVQPWSASDPVEGSP